MIPKIIHYIWLGGKPKPPLVNICILSWHEKLPDYQIIEWNESNLDLDQIAKENLFFAECRKRRMWAYMADYLRLKILYEYGGVYLDTDMQILKSFTPLLCNEGFIGRESEQYISCGIMGFCKNHPLILRALNYYSGQIWHDPVWIIPAILTKLFNEREGRSGLTVYPPKCFYPYAYKSAFDQSLITPDTYTIHWWAASWHGELRPYLFLSTKHIHNRIMKTFIILKKAAGFYYRKFKRTK